jgi:hypothetical protein
MRTSSAAFLLRLKMCDSISAAAVRQNSLSGCESISNTGTAQPQRPNAGVSHKAIHAAVLAVRDAIPAYTHWQQLEVYFVQLPVELHTWSLASLYATARTLVSCEGGAPRR